jgi:cellulose synthase operon protein C
MPSSGKVKTSPARSLRSVSAPRYAAALFLALMLGQCSARYESPGETAARGYEALRKGDYPAAKKLFESAVSAGPDCEDCLGGLFLTLRETGEYEPAGRLAGEMLVRHPDSVLLQSEAGRFAVETGSYARAEKLFRRAIETASAKKDGRRMEIRNELAALCEMLGRHDEALRLWDATLSEYRKSSGTRIQAAEAAKAAWKRGNIEDCKDLFLDATDARGAGEVPLEALSDFGFLFLEKYDATQAMTLFRECLKINKSYPPALLGMALAKEYESNSETEKFARSALAVNPQHVPALCLLAKLEMEEENYAGGLEAVRSALKVNPSNLEALALEAACHQFLGDLSAYSAVEAKILGINPAFGKLYLTLAENYVMHRKYLESVEQSRKAIRLSPELSSAHATLGINLMRVGDLTGGKKALQQAFDLDGFNVWAYNTLDLLDQMDKFIRVKSDHFVFLMSREDEASLAAYAPRLAEEAYEKLARRYGFRPDTPVQVEIFPDHPGFAVRTLGLPGLGALGVCFGTVVAIDSPRARKPGDFNWGSTLWHELTHVITLEMTKHNIPRWYSEGLSVYEERKARPGWGDDLTPAFVRAYKSGKLLKARDLNAGMMRPQFPEQIELSYYQASLFCEMIEKKFGFAKIPETLRMFAENRPADEVFLKATGWDPSALEKEYAEFLQMTLKGRMECLDSGRPGNEGSPHVADRKELAAILEKKPDDFFANLQLGNILAQEKDLPAAEKPLKKALALFPEYIGPGSPYGILSRYYLDSGRENEALTLMAAWAKYDEKAIDPLRKTAEIFLRAKNWAQAVRLLDLSVYIDPYESSVFSQIADAAIESGDWQEAVSACQVLVALNAGDPAGAHFNLARAYLGAGRRQEARRAILKALEIAPSFQQAQELLLKISGVQP